MDIATFQTSLDKIYLMLGAFAKLRKATRSFVMPVCPHGTTRRTLDGLP